VTCLPGLEQRFTLDEFERIWAASHVVLRWVGKVVQLLEEAVLRVDEPNIAELHVTRAVQYMGALYPKEENCLTYRKLRLHKRRSGYSQIPLNS
jgi:hypothetical protein